MYEPQTHRGRRWVVYTRKTGATGDAKRSPRSQVPPRSWAVDVRFTGPLRTYGVPAGYGARNVELEGPVTGHRRLVVQEGSRE
jgi:hypothetical protein